jgi:cytochrome c biogenesis protein CcmG, thiol:disulfide interchange protein DsbE
VARSVKLAAQGLALAAVAGLLVLLVWKVVRNERSTAADRISSGKGAIAPDFDLPQLTGEGRVALAGLRGKAVVLNFWASWCIPCKQESPYLEQTWQAGRARGLVVVGIDEEDVSADARRFVRRTRITYPVVRDKSGAVRDAYGLHGYPETFVVDRRGRIVEYLAGPVDRGDFRDRFERAIDKALGP